MLQVVTEAGKGIGIGNAPEPDSGARVAGSCVTEGYLFSLTTVAA